MTTEQPDKPAFGTPVNWSHPSAAQLRHAFLLNDGGGVPFDSARFFTTGPTLGTTAIWTPRGLDLDGANTAYLDLGSSLDLTGELTALIRFKADSVTGLHTLWGCNKTDGTERTAGSLYLNGTLLSYWTNGVAENLNGTATLATGRWYTVVLVRAGATGSWTFTSYLDGVQDDTATSSSNPSTEGTPGNLRVGFAGAFNGAAFDGLIDCFCLWTRALSPSECLDLTLNPYQLWDEPPPARVRAAAGGGSFQPAWAVNSNVVLGGCF